MRLGLFVATFSGLCAATSLVVPVPYGPRELPGGRAPAAVSPPRCLRLAYDYEQDVYPLLTIVRLHSERLSSSELWLRADGSYPARDTPTFAMWSLRAPIRWTSSGTTPPLSGSPRLATPSSAAWLRPACCPCSGSR